MSQKEEYHNLVIGGAGYTTTYTTKFKNRKKWKRPNPNLIYSHIPGTITEIVNKEGWKVKKGEVILLLEAMKMSNKIVMPFDGRITKMFVRKGEVVPKNHLMIEINPE